MSIDILKLARELREQNLVEDLIKALNVEQRETRYVVYSSQRFGRNFLSCRDGGTWSNVPGSLLFDTMEEASEVAQKHKAFVARVKSYDSYQKSWSIDEWDVSPEPA